jgi:hypothetical protein
MRVRRSDEQHQNPDGHRQRPDGLQGFVEHLVPDFKKSLMKYRRKRSGAKFEILMGRIRVIRYHHFKALFVPHAHIFMMNSIHAEYRIGDGERKAQGRAERPFSASRHETIDNYRRLSTR